MKSSVRKVQITERIAIIAHVYYAHLWNELASSIQIILAQPSDLFITLSSANMPLAERIRQQFPQATIRIVANRGYDIGPFIDTLNQINLDNYKYIAKLHTKRDVTERFKCWVNGRHFYGDMWRKKLLSFCSTVSNFNETLLRLESNPQIGMAAAESLIIREDDVFEHIYTGIPNAAKAFIKSCGLEMGKAEFVAGTMFIARAILFKQIQNRLSINDFPETNDKRYNCDLAYQLERAIGYLVGAQGMYIADYKKDSKIQEFIHAYYRTRLIFLRFMTERFLVNIHKPDISILLLTWNRAPMLRLCLKAMFEALSPESNREIILMDNGSTDETPDILAQYKDIPNVTIVRNASNLGIAGYKKLFSMAKGRIMIEVDDDVIEFPQKFDTTLRDYLDAFLDYGYIALNVVQNDLTTGAKPDQSCYSDDKRGDKIIEEGPTGGWCAAFRRKHYRIFKPLINILNMSMARGEDGILMACMQKILRKRLGLVKNAVCLHAVGPEYARKFDLTQREIEKYKIGGLPEMSNEYNTSM